MAKKDKKEEVEKPQEQAEKVKQPDPVPLKINRPFVTKPKVKQRIWMH